MPNCYLYQSRQNSLSVIRQQIVDKLCPPSQCRLLIFVVDFLLDFNVGVEQVIREITELIELVEDSGHIISFAYLNYVPAYSKDPKTVKDHFSPQPDFTNYITIINNKLQQIASHNPIKACFYNKFSGYNSRKDSYMPTDWEKHSSTAEAHLSYSNCFQLSPAAIKFRAHKFYEHVDQFVNAVK